jgi:hypothetical protein
MRWYHTDLLLPKPWYRNVTHNAIHVGRGVCKEEKQKKENKCTPSIFVLTAHCNT